MGRRRSRGFTLTELLVVVAIISVLVAVAVPVFSTSLDKSRAAVCLANRRGAVAQIASSAMLNEDFRTGLQGDMAWREVRALLADSGETDFVEDLCPEDGAITLVIGENSYALSCRVHGGEEEATEVVHPQWPAAYGTAYKIGDICLYEGTLYVCVQAHTLYNLVDWTPVKAPALWQPYTP